jgi:hypothetical protein
MELFSTKKAAEYLGLKPETIKYHVYTSKYLKPLLVHGRALVFTKEQLDEFKANHQRTEYPRPVHKRKKKNVTTAE